MDPSRLTIDRPIATLMIAIAISVFGFISYEQLPVNLLPKISYPTLTIRTENPGAAPQEIESNITEEIEQIVRTVEGVVEVESTSFAGQSDIVLRFTWNTDMNSALQKVRERVELVRLDENISRPLILRFDPDLDPILKIGLFGDTPAENDQRAISLSLLRRIAEEKIEPEIQKLSGVAMVKIRGGSNQVVRVEVDPNRLAHLGLSNEDVSNRLRAENVNLAGGALIEGNVTYLVRTLNAYTNVEDVASLIITSKEGLLIPLRRVAKVSLLPDDSEVITRMGVGKDIRPSLILEVFREPSANMIEVSSRVRRLLFGDPGAHVKRAQYLAKDRATRIANQAFKWIEKDPSPAAGLAPRRSGILLDDLHENVESGKVQLRVLNDQSTFIKRSVDEVMQTALWGSLFAILVLFLFLRNVWATFIIAIAIPLSVIGTFGAFRFFNVSLNVMSLGGLALGIGMLVDNAVVVLESIVRCREEGDAPRKAASRGTREVAGAVIASTLTSLAVFVPIAFVSGIAGQIFRDLALSVVFSLTASLGFALLFVPMLSARGFGERKIRLEGKSTYKGWVTIDLLKSNVSYWKSKLQSSLLWLPLVLIVSIFIISRILIFFPLEILIGKIGGFFLFWLGRLLGSLFRLVSQQKVRKENDSSFFRDIYKTILSATLRVRYTVVLFSILLFFFSIWRFGGLGTRLLPTLHQGSFEILASFPVGTRLEESAKRIEGLEKSLLDIEGIEQISTVVGVEKSDLNAEGGEHSARILVNLASSEEPGKEETRVSDKARELGAMFPGLTLEIRRPKTLSLKSAIDVQIYYSDLEKLQKGSQSLHAILGEVDGIRDLRNSLRSGFPEIRIELDRLRLASLGISAKEVGEAIRSQIQGIKSTEIQSDDFSYDVLLRTDPRFLQDVDGLRRLVIRPGGVDNADVELGVISTISIAKGPSEIRHISGRRVAVLSADVALSSLSETSKKISALLDANPPPPGMSYVVGGQSGMTDKALENLLYAFLLAVFLVYIVLASKFESFRGPFVILLSIPLAISGVVLALELTKTHISVLVFVGLIMLAGIVVNNAIVLVDYINQMRVKYEELDEAILVACSARLRPVLITTLTTVLGLIPMAFGLGEGAELRQPLAITVISGLLSATLLTLLVIPALYRIVLKGEQPHG